MKPNGPGQSALLLLDILPTLGRHNISYAIIGAFAASFYGVVRASLDADLVISLRQKEALVEQLRLEFEGGGFQVEYQQGDSEDPIKAVMNVRDAFQNRVDLLLGIRGMSEEVFDRVEVATFMDTRIKIVGLEDFIAMKIFAGSPKDIADIVGVLEVSGEKVKTPLLREIVSIYGSAELKKLEGLLLKR